MDLMADVEWSLVWRTVGVVFSSLLASLVVIAVIALLSPKIKIFDRIMLKAKITGTAGGPDPDSPVGKTGAVEPAPPVEDDEDLSALVGKTGTAGVLRPSGKAVIDGHTYIVEADNEFVEAGSSVAVIRVRGNRIIVRKQ
ncbi:MAG: NfeD family protein [Spirochaetes bacterium]|nr:NfeD family protein [Spirochaetota bacterium]